MTTENNTNQEPKSKPTTAPVVVDCDDLLSQKIGELEFKEIDVEFSPEDSQYAHHSEFGSFTVLDRMTGFGWRDVETGFRDPEGRFWLVSGNFSIRSFPELTVKEAIQKIKDEANTRKG